MNDIQNILKKFKIDHPDKKIIFFMIAGSHFFNLNSKNSDRDYKGIYIPLKGIDTKTGEISYKTNTKTHTKNQADDIDCVLFSLKKFLNLLKTGDFNILEMLFAPKDKIIISEDIYEYLHFIRENLVINDISPFLGFIKREYRRYGVDKNHYKSKLDLISFLDSLKKIKNSDTLKDHWEEIVHYANIPTHYLKITSTLNEKKVFPSISISRMIFQDSAKIDYVIHNLKKNLEQYGHRKKEMLKTGVEFKALYHAMRLIYEAKDILLTGKLSFPLSKERVLFLKSIKEGTIDPTYLFQTIDEQIEILYKLEQTITSNKKNVLHLIDKVIWIYYGRLEIQSLINKFTQTN